MQVYLDYAATSPVRPEVVEAMLPYFTGEFGNPSTLYSLGRRASRALNESRNSLAEIMGASPKEIIFTSGGTESDNIAIKGVALANADRGKHIITTTIEHPAVLNSCRTFEKAGFEVTCLPVGKEGIISASQVEQSIREDTILISVMHANNEIGTIQPVSDIGKIARKKGIYFHIDGVQSFGKLPFTMTGLNADLFSISGHKIGGPKGTGAIYIRKGTRITPLFDGGGQEGALRSGTENIPGIAGLACAARLAAEEMAPDKTAALRDYFAKRIMDDISGIIINGDMTGRLPNNLNISITGAEGEAVLIRLDSAGISCATGSACSSALHKGSHVLQAIGLSPELVKSSLRFTLGQTTTREELDYTVSRLSEIVKDLRNLSSF